MPALSDPNEAGGGSLLNNVTGKVEKGVLTVYSSAPKEGKSLVDCKKAASALGGKPRVTESELEVMFNPESITIDAQGGGYAPQRSLQDNENPKKPNLAKNQSEGGKLPSRIEVNFTLLFDTMTTQDAFMFETLDNALSPSNAAHLVKNAMSQPLKSVQPIVEGIISSMVSEKQCRIKFTWGKMTFAGRLSDISSKYTMFNPDGTPVRGEVTISMICIEELAGGKLIGNVQDWSKMYKYMLDDASSSKSFLDSVKKSAGNLLGL